MSLLPIRDEGRGPNTRFRYCYRDASNYKRYGEITVAGQITAAEVEAIQANLVNGAGFDPDTVGLDDVKWGGSYEDDPWLHEALSFEHTYQPADSGLFADFAHEMATATWPPDPGEPTHVGTYSTMTLVFDPRYRAALLDYLKAQAEWLPWFSVAQPGVTPAARELGADPDCWAPLHEGA